MFRQRHNNVEKNSHFFFINFPLLHQVWLDFGAKMGIHALWDKSIMSCCFYEFFFKSQFKINEVASSFTCLGHLDCVQLLNI